MSERRMSDAMWVAAELLWNNDIPGWMIAEHYGIAVKTLWNYAETHDWKSRAPYSERRIQPNRRSRPGGRRMTDTLERRCQECQQRYTGSHVCSGRRIA